MAYDDDIIAFIKARLDEDEAAATAATPGPWRAPCGPDDDSAVIEGRDGHVVADSHSCPDHPHRGAADALHIIRHGPARTLREVEAKRRVVDDYRISVNACRNVTGAELDSLGYKSMCGGRDAFRAACAALAAIYSDHPDYRQAWKP